METRYLEHLVGLNIERSKKYISCYFLEFFSLTPRLFFVRHSIAYKIHLLDRQSSNVCSLLSVPRKLSLHKKYCTLILNSGLRDHKYKESL